MQSNKISFKGQRIFIDICVQLKILTYSLSVFGAFVVVNFIENVPPLMPGCAQFSTELLSVWA